MFSNLLAWIIGIGNRLQIEIDSMLYGDDD